MYTLMHAQSFFGNAQKGINGKLNQMKSKKELGASNAQDDFTTAPYGEHMEALIHLFHPTAEIIAEFKAKHANRMQANQETILAMLKRRPCMAAEIAGVCGMHPNEVSKYLGNLMRTRKIRVERKNAAVYYEAASSEGHRNLKV